MKKLELKHHSDGVPYVRPYLGTNKVTGKPMRPYKRFPEAADDDEAMDMAQEWVNGIATASDYHVSMKLVEVMHAYIDHLRVANAAYNTCKTYDNAVKNYIAPNVGNLAVDALTPALVDALYAVVRARGGKDGKPIAANTLRKLHWLLRGAYKWFCTSGIASANPMLAVDTPKPDKSQAVAFDESEFAVLQKTLAKATRTGREQGSDLQAQRCLPRRTTPFGLASGAAKSRQQPRRRAAYARDDAHRKHHGRGKGRGQAPSEAEDRAQHEKHQPSSRAFAPTSAPITNGRQATSNATFPTAG